MEAVRRSRGGGGLRVAGSINRGVNKVDKTVYRPLFGTCGRVLHLTAVIEVDYVPVKRFRVSGEVCGFDDLQRLFDDLEEHVINTYDRVLER